MALIRQSIARTMARDAIVLDLGDLTRQAEEITARARSEAGRILAQARAEREQIVAGAAEQGRSEGLAQGLEEGRAQGQNEGREAAMHDAREQLARLDQAWSEALDGFSSSRERMLSDMRQSVLRLAIRMGEMVTKQTLDAHPEAVIDQFAAVLALLVRPTRLVVRVHPDDLSILRDALPALSERFTAAAHVELIPDHGLDRGSCIARTGNGEGSAGEIDASIEVQLERIVEAMLPVASPADAADERPEIPPAQEGLDP